jgi:hypothetical protein
VRSADIGPVCPSQFVPGREHQVGNARSRHLSLWAFKNLDFGRVVPTPRAVGVVVHGGCPRRFGGTSCPKYSSPSISSPSSSRTSGSGKPAAAVSNSPSQVEHRHIWRVDLSDGGKRAAGAVVHGATPCNMLLVRNGMIFPDRNVDGCGCALPGWPAPDLKICQAGSGGFGSACESRPGWGRFFDSSRARRRRRCGQPARSRGMPTAGAGVRGGGGDGWRC